MKFTIITVVFNGKTTIKATIDSVLNQKHPHLEYIIVDGGSSDGTIELVHSYGSRISKFISEKDHGLYDAMNNGIGLATGDVIGFLNSDDFYPNNNVIADVAEVFEKQKIDCCYGDIQYVDQNDTSKIVRKWRARPYHPGMMKSGWYPPHPAFFVKKSIIDKYGGFDLRYRLSADYEMILRLLEKHKISFAYIPKVIAKMRLGGASNRSLNNIVWANMECYKAWKNNNLPINPLAILLKPLGKLLQYIYK